MVLSLDAQSVFRGDRMAKTATKKAAPKKKVAAKPAKKAAAKKPAKKAAAKK